MRNQSATALENHAITEGEIRLFEGIPGNNVLVLNDPPRFTILGVTEGYLKLAGKRRDQLIGNGIFDVFPSNPGDETDTGEPNLRFSFHEVITHKKPHHLPTQRYDVANAGGSFEERYWDAGNTPILAENGEVKAIVHSAVEITYQMKAEQREDRIRLMEQAHNLFMQAPLAIAILTGENFVVELANEPIMRVWGKGADVTGKPILEVLPEIESQGFVDLMKGVVTTGEPFHAYEMPVNLLRNGKEEVVYFNFVYQPYYVRGTTAPIGIIIFANEVTEQVLSRKKVEKGEQRIRSIVESAPFPIGVYVGKEMRIELANQTIIDIYGKGPDVIGKRYSEVLPELDNQEIFQQLDAVFTSGIAYHAKNQRVDLAHEGTLQTFYFNYSFTPLFDERGNVYGVMNTAADVTDLALAKQEVEKSKENLRNMILQAPVAMCIFKGPEYVVDIANERMIEIWGKTPGEVMNKPIFEGLPEVKEQGLEKLLGNVYTTGETFNAFEMPVKLPRAGKVETTYINFVYEPFYEVEGKISGVIAVAVEVTEQVLARRKIEEVVAQRTKELAEANAALLRSNVDLKRSNVNLEEFAYAASHDLKEPIRKIHFFSDRLKVSLSERMTEVEKQSFEKMETAAKRMSSLIDDLLSYSQVSLRPGAFEEVDMNQVIEQVLVDLDLEIEQKSAVVQVEKLCVVQGHHRQLQQAFQNLIANAVKYSKPDVPPVIRISCELKKGIQLHLSLSLEEREKDFWAISVADNGIGFEQRDAERIFNVFTRLHGNVEYRGTGVGLSIVRKVTENHHGYVTAESSPEKGSVFTVYLPA